MGSSSCYIGNIAVEPAINTIENVPTIEDLIRYLCIMAVVFPSDAN